MKITEKMIVGKQVLQKPLELGVGCFYLFIYFISGIWHVNLVVVSVMLVLVCCSLGFFVFFIFACL